MALAYTGGSGGGGGGGVQSVAAGDTSIIVGGTATNPTLEARTIQFDYQESTASVNVTGTSGAQQTIFTSPSLTFDGSTRILIEFDAGGQVISAGGNASLIVEVYEDGVSLGRIVEFLAGATGTWRQGAHRGLFRTPSAAAHVYAIKAWFAGSSASLSGGSDVPFWYRITLA